LRRYDEDLNGRDVYGEYGHFVLPVCVNGFDVLGLHVLWRRSYTRIWWNSTGEFVFCRGALDNGTVVHKMSQFGNDKQNPNTPRNSIGLGIAMRCEPDAGVNITVAARDIDTADR